MTTPGTGAPISFERDIKPLFTESDRRSMRFAFDLWAVDEVRSNAEAILERLADGSMPCDRGWPADRIDLFRRWVAEGAKD